MSPEKTISYYNIKVDSILSYDKKISQCFSMDIQINDSHKADCFGSLFQNIKFLTDCINISFTVEHMYIQAMDSSRVSIFEIFIPSTWFDVYNKTGPNMTTIGVNAGILHRILGSRDKSQSIQMVYNQMEENDGEDKFFIHMRGDTKNVFDKNFELPLFDLEVDNLEIPLFEYQAELSLSSSNFASIVNQLKMFGDTMDIECSEDKIQLCATSVEQGKMYVDIEIDDLSTFAIDENEKLKMSFSLKYLHTICMYNKLAKDIEIRLSQDLPIRIDYDLGEGANVKFYLAPKIREDD